MKYSRNNFSASSEKGHFFLLPSLETRLIINKFCILSPVVSFSSFCTIQNVCLRMEAKKKSWQAKKKKETRYDCNERMFRPYNYLQ